MIENSKSLWLYHWQVIRYFKERRSGNKRVTLTIKPCFGNMVDPVISNALHSINVTRKYIMEQALRCDA